MRTDDPRRSDRVVLSLPLEVSGQDSHGEEFREKARTLVISRNGATVVLSRKLPPGQAVNVRRTKGSKNVNARIVGQIGGQPESYVYGMVLTNPGENPWGIGFPPLTEAEEAVVRILLVCTACHAREVAYLNELESEVFEANKNLSRACEACNAWTLWEQATHELPDDASPVHPRASQAASGKNRRRAVRVQTKMTACVRQPGFGEEVVAVENLSRGGLGFLSPNIYFEGSRIEVAVPYTPGAANIFVPARIVRKDDVIGQDVKKYGAVYMTHKA